jgi:hypothetical protein
MSYNVASFWFSLLSQSSQDHDSAEDIISFDINHATVCGTLRIQLALLETLVEKSSHADVSEWKGSSVNFSLLEDFPHFN